MIVLSWPYVTHFNLPLVLVARYPPRPTLFPYTTLFRSRPRPLGLLCLSLAACSPPRTADIMITGGVVWTGLSSGGPQRGARSEEHTSELQSHSDLVCRLLLEKKNTHSCSADES